MRCFVAVDLPQQTRERVHRLQQKLNSSLQGLRWVRPSGLHVTLSFLGEIDSETVSRHCQALALEISGRETPFEVRLQEIGWFPARGRLRVLWLGLKDSRARPGGIARLDRLRSRVQKVVGVMGMTRNLKIFHPHLTLARGVGGQPEKSVLVDVAARHAEKPQGSFLVSSLCLFESILGSEGARYRKIEEFRF